MQQSEDMNIDPRSSNLDCGSLRQSCVAGPAAPDTINLLDYLEVIVRYKRMIIRMTLAAFVISIVVSLLLPKIYSSTTLILPPQQDTGIMKMMMGQMGGGVASIAGDLLGKGSPADLYVGILKSEAISDAIIDRFKLIEVYKQKFRTDTYNALASKVAIAAGKKNGIISISVEDRDPRRAADIANAYVEELRKITVRLSITGAREDKAFLEEQLAKARVDLSRSEENLKKFQSRNKALDITEQAKGTIKGVADLEGQLAAEEVKLAGLKRIFTDNTQEVKNQKAIVANLHGQITKFEGMRSGGTVPGAASVPELGQQYLRLMREFKIQETLVELLTKQFELAKLTEAKDVASVQVLQTARIPDKKIKPKRSTIVLVSTSIAALVAVLYAFLRETRKQMSDECKQRWNNIMRLLRTN